jgi:hypothetical protein
MAIIPLRSARGFDSMSENAQSEEQQGMNNAKIPFNGVP